MRDMLEEFGLKSQPDMVEENQMLVHLPHVANVRYYRKIEDFRKEADGQELTDTRHSRAVDLDKGKRFRFYEVLEQDTVCDMFPGCDFDRTDGP